MSEDTESAGLLEASCRAAIEDLTSRQAIVDVLYRFCERIDEGEIRGVVSLFTEDCLTDYGPIGGGLIMGREAFARRLTASQSRFERTHHQLGQVRVSVLGGSARTVAYVTAVHQRWDGGLYVAHLQYHDEWMRSTSGTWLISSRVALTALVQGTAEVDGPDGPRRWVPRAQLRPPPE